MRGNTIQIELPLKRGKVSKTIPLYQYDYGQNLVITGAELPDAYEVHFANEMHGDAVTSIGGSTGVAIPDSVLTSGDPIYLWLYLHEDSTDGETEFQGVIPVIKRASISDQTPTPAEQSAITEAIAALNSAVTQTTAAKNAAVAAQTHIENLSVSATSTTPEAGASVTKTVNAQGEVNLAFAIPRGDKGDKGDQGIQGEPGTSGTNGTNGVSPVVSLTKADGVTTFSVTDAVDTYTVEINDGEPGDPTDLIDDTAGSGDTDVTWSANKLANLTTTVGSKADLVSSPTEGNFAALTAGGNLTDSGHKHSDYLTSHQDISGKSDLTNLAAAFSSSATYAVGDHVTYNGKYYVCSTAISTAGAWDSSKWTEKTVGAETKSLLTEIVNRPEIKATDAESDFFDVADDNGNVILRLKSGHIETQKFKSEDAPNVSATDSGVGTFDVADSVGNVILRLIGGHIQTKRFNSAERPNPIEYKFSGDDLLLAYKYTSTHDAVVVLNVGRANDLFDFSKFCLKGKEASLKDLETEDLTVVWSSGTDMHSPFQFNVTTGADGYYASSSDPSFTGGNHTVEINGNNIKSAASKYVYFFADGKPVSDGYGLCNHFTMKWANEVQAYNCVKADGTGRTGLIEYHEMIFDGVRFNEEIILIPKEEITMKLWYGLQSVSWKTTFTKVRFIDGANRNEFDTEDNSIASGNAKTSGMIETGDNHSMEITIDTGCDLGARPYYSGTSGAFIVSYGTSGKGYFNIINQNVTMEEGDGYFLRGSYRFYPTVS